MGSSGGGSGQNFLQVLRPEAVPLMREAIFLVLSRWTALKMAVDNGWGGRESVRLAEEFASSIMSWFTQSNEPFYIDDLENFLYETMYQSFNTEIEDGSVEEVAEQLMTIHEDLMHGNYTSIENLKKSTPVLDAPSLIRQDIAANANEILPSGSDMMASEPSGTKKDKYSNKLDQVPDEEGWCVASKRHRGKKKTG